MAFWLRFLFEVMGLNATTSIVLKDDNNASISFSDHPRNRDMLVVSASPLNLGEKRSKESEEKCVRSLRRSNGKNDFIAICFYFI